MTNKSLAFTLIEMLVVISIMMLLSSIIMISFERSETEALNADALALQTVLQRARSLAMSSGKEHAVSFHIENAGDGTVLKNGSSNDEIFQGRHWYVILGPDTSDVSEHSARRSSKRPPVVRNNGSGTYDYTLYTFFTLKDYEEALTSVQVGPRYYLSEGVRFLALTDLDKLDYRQNHASYPRPWFGYYDEGSNTLYPWGAYNRDVDASFSAPNTGLDYEGVDGPIPYDVNLDTNVNPAQVWGRLYYEWDYINEAGTGATAFTPSHIGLQDRGVNGHFKKIENYQGPDTTVYPGTPRPIVNAYWADFMIIFSPLGSASIVTGHSRRVYLNYSSWGRWKNYQDGRAHIEIASQEKRTGGFSITLSRDIDEDSLLYTQSNAITGSKAYNKFDSVEDAFESITPFLQVHVNKFSGVADIRDNTHPTLGIEPEDLKQHDPYPNMD